MVEKIEVEEDFEFRKSVMLPDRIEIMNSRPKFNE